MARARKLDTDTIARAAFDLVDAEGVGALTIARLAAELDVGTMTLYGYAASKDEIVGLMPAVLLADLPELSLDEDWRTAIETIFVTVYERLVEHANVTRAIVQVPVFDLAQARLFEGVLQVLRNAGLSLEDAFLLHRSLSTFTIGYALFQITESAEDAPRRDRLELHPTEFPLASRTTKYFTERQMSKHFVRALRIFVSGFAADGGPQ